MPDRDPICVLFVCLGNICRSPMAKGVFQHLVDERGLSNRIVVDSAGTGNWHVGKRAHHGTCMILAEHDIDFDHRARQVTFDDLNHFDYVLAMDRKNLADLHRVAGDRAAEICLFMNYAEGINEDEVPDPYYDGRFEEVYQLVCAAAEGLLDYICAKHGL